jgi:hypothetical protein
MSQQMQKLEQDLSGLAIHPCMASEGYLQNTENWDPPLYITKEVDIANISFNNEIHCYEPFTKNIETGKNTYTYDAHTYHTKVPPQGIEEIIKHYTHENGVVCDPFCGSGMTGVAATNVNRQTILSDISPAAAFIAYNYLSGIDPEKYMHSVCDIINNLSELNNVLYHIKREKCGKITPILYQVWSYGVLCPFCNEEFVLWDVARDENNNIKESKILAEFNYPHCSKHLIKRNLKRTTLHPVQIGYRCCVNSLKKMTKKPDEDDLNNIKIINDMPINTWYPDNEFQEGINTRQVISAGITSIDKLYIKRALIAYSSL